MSKFHVLVTDRFDAEAYTQLLTNSRLSVSRASAHDLEGESALDQIEGLIIRSRTPITSALLSRLPKLKVVITATSGYDHVDLEACALRNVKVMFTPDANAASAAELTWALVLACARKIPTADRAARTGSWKREALMGTQLSGKTYGIVGLGRIGSRVANIAQAFGLKTLAYDPYKNEEDFQAHGCERVGLDELFKMADVVSCHVPATDETKGMISRNLLGGANRGLIFVNTSRGSIVANTDLVEALKAGRLSACGLDVFEREPLPVESELVKQANVVLSPHLGATTHEAFRAASFEAADKMSAFAERSIVTDELPCQAPAHRRF